MQTSLAKKHDRSKMVLTIAFTVICIVYVLPIVIVLINSFKTNAAVNTDTFALPNDDTFVGWQNYIKGMTFGNYPFIKAVFYSLFITLVSSALILICTSMAAWYVARVGSLFSKIVYYLCVFSMVVPFQMVMFTLSRTAEQVKLPYFSLTFCQDRIEHTVDNTYRVPGLRRGTGGVHGLRVCQDDPAGDRGGCRH